MWRWSVRALEGVGLMDDISPLFRYMYTLSYSKFFININIKALYLYVHGIRWFKNQFPSWVNYINGGCISVCRREGEGSHLSTSVTAPPPEPAPGPTKRRFTEQVWLVGTRFLLTLYQLQKGSKHRVNQKSYDRCLFI